MLSDILDVLSGILIAIIPFAFWLTVIFVPPLRKPLLVGFVLIMLGFTAWLVYQQDAANGVVVYTANLADFHNKPDGVVMKHWIESPFIAIPSGLCVFAVMVFVWIKLRFPTIHIEIEPPK